MDFNKNRTFKLMDYSLFDKNDDEDIDKFIKGQSAKKTIEATKYAWNVFRKYLNLKSIAMPEKDVEPAILDMLLSRFLMEVTK